MTHAPHRPEGKSGLEPVADLAHERLPASPSPGAVRRHARLVAVREKRAKGAAEKTEGKLSRDTLLCRLWDAASLGASWVAPRIREHFLRCVAACLANERVKFYLDGQSRSWSRASLERSPVVRVEFEQAFVLGQLGESLSAARNKSWGKLLGVDPVEPQDPVDSCRIGYVFKDSSRYQKRFEQRRRLKRMLGKNYARLVGEAMRSGKEEFVARLSDDDVARLRARTGLAPGKFWRAARGREFIDWPESPRQLTLFEVD